MSRPNRTHLYLAVDGVAWPIIEPSTFIAAGVLHAVDFRDATKATTRKTRDAVCGKRIAPNPVVVLQPKEDVALPWPPPARNPIGTRCPACFAAAHLRRPDWTWTAWTVAPRLAAEATS